LPRVRIVTDSAVHFTDPAQAERMGVVVVPHTIQFGNQTFREGSDITSEEFFRRVALGESTPVMIPPTFDDFTQLYTDLSRTTDNILSIHTSSKLSRTYRHAKMAADALLGRTQVRVVDSMTISRGLGILVEAAMRAVEEGQSLDEIVRLVRGTIHSIYMVFVVDDLTYLERSGRMGQAQAILGTMLGIKPFLTIEEGDLIPMEKVRSRDKVMEKLVEFITEFSDIEELAILQSARHPTEDTRMLLERLAVEYPDQQFPVMMYGPTLGCFIGPNSLGVLVYEGEDHAAGY
jgi:DegV family protein with EDD domain